MGFNCWPDKHSTREYKSSLNLYGTTQIYILQQNKQITFNGLQGHDFNKNALQHVAPQLQLISNKELEFLQFFFSQETQSNRLLLKTNLGLKACKNLPRFLKSARLRNGPKFINWQRADSL